MNVLWAAAAAATAAQRVGRPPPRLVQSEYFRWESFFATALEEEKEEGQQVENGIYIKMECRKAMYNVGK